MEGLGSSVKRFGKSLDGTTKPYAPGDCGKAGIHISTPPVQWT